MTTCGFDMVYTSCCVHTQLEQLLVDDVFTAFSADGLNESHPIVQTVSNPNEINALFDSISYSKVRVWELVEYCHQIAMLYRIHVQCT